MSSLAAQLLLVADQAGVSLSGHSFIDAVPLPADQREQVVAESRELCAQIESLARAMPEAEDEPELYRSLAGLWLELRFQWQRHNLVANYDMVQRGACAPLVLVRASAASLMLQRIEQLLAPPHRDRLNHAAVELLDRLRDECAVAAGAV
jgi:hypothetical protein